MEGTFVKEILSGNNIFAINSVVIKTWFVNVTAKISLRRVKAWNSMIGKGYFLLWVVTVEVKFV